MFEQYKAAEANVNIEILHLLGDGSPVNHSAILEEPGTCRLGDARRNLEPCSIVIFGASGDLPARKLIPAFYHLSLEQQMPSEFRIIGFARREKDDTSWRQ